MNLFVMLVREACRAQTVLTFKSNFENFILYAFINWQPVELLKEGCAVYNAEIPNRGRRFNYEVTYHELQNFLTIDTLFGLPIRRSSVLSA